MGTGILLWAASRSQKRPWGCRRAGSSRGPALLVCLVPEQRLLEPALCQGEELITLFIPPSELVSLRLCKVRV